jgi:hypothetical protein
MDFPADLASQNSKTVDIVRSLVEKVLGRREDFSLTVRKGSQRRYAKDSSMVMIPPVEVISSDRLIYYYKFNIVHF